MLAPIAVLVVAACSMVSSNLLNEVGQSGGCHSDGGTYFLSRSLVKITIVSTKGEGNEANQNYILNSVSTKVEPDRNRGFCLDYLASPTSDDHFHVEKTNGGLIGKVTTRADDKSADIAKTVIDTIFTAISRDPNFGAGIPGLDRNFLSPRLGDSKVFEGEYDPFNQAQAALVNEGLNDYGFCLVLEKHTFDYHYQSIQDYCDNPLKYTSRERAIEDSIRIEHQGSAPAMPQPGTNGIFYRPRLPYSYFLFVKQDPQQLGGWRTRGTATVFLENISPIFAIGIDRTYFATRSTTLDFDRGVLTDVEIVKDSELANFVTIPLTIAQAVAALPASIIQVRFDLTNNRQKLVNAQSALLQAERERLTALRALDAERAKGAPKAAQAPPQPRPQFFGDTVAQGAGGGTKSLAAQTEEFNQCFTSCKGGKETKDVACQKFCQCVVYDCGKLAETSAKSCRNSCDRLLP